MKNNQNQNLKILEDRIGINFENKDILKEALTHRSYLNEAKNRNLNSNERLEFLGDSILSFVVSFWIFKEFKKYPEGKLTNLRSNLVKTSALARVASKFELGNYLFMSRGEQEAQGQKNPTLNANAMESLIGAIFIDQGIEQTEQFIKKNFTKMLKKLIASGKFKDYKSLLQEKIQAQSSQSPLYKTIKEEGPEHNKIFTINVVYRDGEIIASGNGKSKQKAEQEAAKLALEKLASKKYH